MQQILTYTFLVLYSVTILGIVLVIITDNRNPLKTLPWIIVLVLAPVVGLVFYFFFGQNLSKQRIISRRMRKRITLQLEEAEHAAGPGIPKAYRPLARLLRTTSHAVPLYGSRITPYTDGSSKMEALLGEIARARTTSTCSTTSSATTKRGGACAMHSWKRPGRGSTCGSSTTTWDAAASANRSSRGCAAKGSRCTPSCT